MYPISKQTEFVTNLDKLRALSPDLATGFRALREPIETFGPLGDRDRELVLITGFASQLNEPAFRVHVNKAHRAGLSIREIEQAVLFLLGTSLGLAPVVRVLEWVHDELGFESD